MSENSQPVSQHMCIVRPSLESKNWKIKGILLSELRAMEKSLMKYFLLDGKVSKFISHYLIPDRRLTNYL